MFTERVTEPEFDIAPDVEPTTRCPYCGRPFRLERYATFHVGIEHADECSDDDLESFDAEREDEEYDLFTFHLKAAVSVFLVYFMFSFMYALVWAG